MLLTPTPVAGAGVGAAGSGTAGAAAAPSAGAAGLPQAGASAANGGNGGSAAAGAGATPSTDCDRACLLKLMQSYLDAVIAHDPSKLTFSATLKMTDNGVAAKPGDGLWKTATLLVPDERLDFADPVNHNVATQCVINEGSMPVMYEARLKYEAGQITEVESITVRQQGAANGFFTPANVKPQPVFAQMPDSAKRMTRDQLTMLQEAYLDYLEGKKKGSDIPFDTMCARYENGVATASGTASFNAQSWGFQVTRRILIIDEEAGITYGMFPFQQTDNALVVGEAFKMLDGKIMMIQAIMAYMPSKAWN
jgi:hypothetical protein